MRKTFTQEERERYNDQKQKEFKEHIKALAETWQDSPENIAEFIQFQLKFYNYSARNNMLIYFQNPNASFVGSFKAFKDMGYSVVKEEHGMSISVFAPIHYFRKKPDAPWKLVRYANEEEKEMLKAGMLETYDKPHFKVGTVFDITQTNCPKEDYPKLLGLGYDDTQHAEIYKVVRDYCEQIGIPVKEENLYSATLRGQYSPYENRIIINALFGDTQKLSTLFHEMSHGMLGHRIDDEVKTSAQREIEADALSMMFEQQYGIPITDTRKSHLANNYMQYCKEQNETSKAVEIDELFSPVNTAFQFHVERLQEKLDRAEIHPTVQKEAQSKELRPPEKITQMQEERHISYDCSR